MHVYVVDEVKIPLFSFESERDHGGSTSTAIKYNGDRFILQTPFVFCPFGVSPYKTEFSDGWSIAFNAPQDLLSLFERLDVALKEEADGDEYVPIIKKRDGKPDLIRVRVNETSVGMDMDQLHVIVPERSRVRMLLQMMPMWKMGGRYGVTFKVRAVEAEEVTFR